MTQETQFIYFPLLPFEIREFVWEEAAALGTSQSVLDDHNVSWSSGTFPQRVEFARGKIITYREQGRRPPAIAHACQQARAVALKYKGLWRTEPLGFDGGEKRDWEFLVDTVLLSKISPRIFLGKNVATITKAASCVAIPVTMFTERGSIPLDLFELIAAVNKQSSYGAQIVVNTFSVQLTRDAAIRSGLFGTNCEEKFQLLNVRNTNLLTRFAQLIAVQHNWPHTPLELPNDMHVLAGSEAGRTRLVDGSIQLIEDFWLDCQRTVFGPKGMGGKHEILARGGGSRYNRQHPWVQGALGRMPKFDVILLVKLDLWEA
jgi:hypothetical protein